MRMTGIRREAYVDANTDRHQRVLEGRGAADPPADRPRS
jgi:hypothetical protein